MMVLILLRVSISSTKRTWAHEIWSKSAGQHSIFEIRDLEIKTYQMALRFSPSYQSPVKKAWSHTHTPRTCLHSSRGFWPCCPAKSCVALACWRRTWPGCTAGPPTSLDLFRAPSSEPWPSEPFWYVWSGPSHRMGKLYSVEEEAVSTVVGFIIASSIAYLCQFINKKSQHKGRELISDLDGLVTIRTVVDYRQRLLEACTSNANDISYQLTDSNHHL